MSKRKLRIEQLESRRLFHADVNLDHQITAADVITVINHLERPDAIYDINVDVNDDGRITARDALSIINDLEPYQRQQKVVRVKLGHKLSTHGLTSKQVMWAIKSAFYEYEQTASIRFDIVSSGQRFTISSKEIYGGNGVHYRGLASGNHVFFHSGYVGAGHSRYREDAFWWKAMADPRSLKKILMHEIGHINNWPHSSNGSCVMHINASVDKFCQAERNHLIKWFGETNL